jgi:hypothetical protein
VRTHLFDDLFTADPGGILQLCNTHGTQTDVLFKILQIHYVLQFPENNKKYIDRK